MVDLTIFITHCLFSRSVAAAVGGGGRAAVLPGGGGQGGCCGSFAHTDGQLELGADAGARGCGVRAVEGQRLPPGDC